MTFETQQSQTQTLTSVQAPRRFSRGFQVVLIAAALLVLMGLAVGIREYVGVQGTDIPSDVGTLPPTATVEIDDEVWESHSDTISGKFLASRHAERTGDLGVAADLLLDILKNEPDYAQVSARAHVLLTAEGRFEEARPLAASLLAEDPDRSTLADLTMAMKFVEEGDYETALDHILNIPHQGANGILVPMLEAWTFVGLGETEAALESLTPLGRNTAFSSLKGIHAGTIADLGGDPVRAEEEYALALGDGEALPLRVAELYFSFLSRQGRWDEAAAFMERYLEQNPDNLLAEPLIEALEAREEVPLPIVDAHGGFAEAFYSIANILNSRQPDIQPLIYARFSLQLAPNRPRTLFLLGDILNAQERAEQAIEVFEQIDEESPFSWYARLSIANALADKGQAEDAVKLLEKMSRERPDRPDAPRSLGDIQRVEENYRQAVEAYDQAAERIGELEERDWQLMYTRGISLERRSVARDLNDEEKAAAWARAESDFLKALELSPDQPLVLNYLGYSWVEKGVNLGEAREMIVSSVSQRPRDGYITDSMGWVLYRLGEFEEAVVHLERAVELEPADPVINDHLGDAYWIVGRQNEARFQWTRALENEPDEDLKEDLLAKLAGEKEPQPQPPGQDSE
jgi:tetratricopeptide (TPR) repeat protein